MTEKVNPSRPDKAEALTRRVGRFEKFVEWGLF